MAVIAYGVCSEGMGHATRSKNAIEALLQAGHEVHIFTSDRAYDFLSKEFDNVHEIKGFHLVYKNNSVSQLLSAVKIITDVPLKTFPTVKTLAQEFLKIKPEVIVSDHESFTCLLGEYAGIPVISTSNISITDKTKTEFKDYPFAKILTITVDRLSNFRSDYFVIPTFFYPSLKRKNVILTSPVVREEVVKKKATNKGHILVYHTSPTCLSLLEELAKLKHETFKVYGFGKRRNKKNVIFNEFSNEQFISDLASSKAVITRGGFSLISESLFLKKPVLSVPLKGHYEQLTNAYYIQRMKFGEMMCEPSKDQVFDFLLKLPMYNHYLSEYSFDPNEYSKTILKLVKKTAKKKSHHIRLSLLHTLTGGFIKNRS